MYMILCHLSGNSCLFSGTLICFTDIPSFCIGNLFGSLRVAFEAVFLMFYAFFFFFFCISLLLFIAFLEAGLTASVADFFVLSRIFCSYLLFKLLLIFFTNDKNP